MPDKITSLYRARLAKEKGAARKDWGGKIRIALAYPNYYRIGMSNLGFQVVYHLLNGKENVVAERVFLPEGIEMSLFAEAGKGILSLESLSPLGKFDIIAFSLSFENDYINILRILELGRIPLFSEERDEHYPLVMAGGIMTFLNPEPLAPFFDFFLLGEAEAVLNEFIDEFAEQRLACNRKREILESLARRCKSVYVPSLYAVDYHKDGTIKSMEPTDSSIPAKIQVSRQASLDAHVAASSILTPETEFADKVLVELGRGCGRSCRFCAAGYVYRPPRYHEAPHLLACIDKLLEKNRQIGLLATSVCDIPGIENIARFIVDSDGSFSVSSLRADALTEEILEHLKNSGQKTLAIAPEVGTDRLAKMINKHLFREQIIRAVQMIARTGNFAIRLYFMIGLPTETREDVEGIVELVKSIRHHLIKESSTRGSIGQIRLSVNCFIPKPFTPFQWFPMDNVVALKDKQRWLKKILSREGGIKVTFDLPKWAYVQSLLSMGDRRAGILLHLVHKHGGDWVKGSRFSDINPDFFVYRPKGHDEILPWDFIDHGIRKEHLIKEYNLALKGEESDVCHVGQCVRCGVCER